MTPVLRFVAAGDPVQIAVEGGFVRRPAPADGVPVDLGNTCGWVPWSEIVALKKAKARK